jgi:hypothetical protein
MVLPVEDESKLQNIENNLQFLRDKFIEDVAVVKNKIFRKLKPK